MAYILYSTESEKVEVFSIFSACDALSGFAGDMRVDRSTTSSRRNSKSIQWHGAWSSCQISAILPSPNSFFRNRAWWHFVSSRHTRGK